MKLSDIKGKRSLDVLADMMELLGDLAEDDRFDALVKDLQQAKGNKAVVVLCKHFPALLRDERYADRIVSVIASAKEIPVDEYRENGDVLGDLMELLTTDAASLAFLSGPPAREE